MKQSLFLFMILLTRQVVFACDVCQKQQPKVLQGITHGTGPQSKWDYFIVVVVALLVITTLFYSLKSLLNPKEQAEDHIKYSILK
jgi:uncharacterized protein HemY